MIKIYTVFSGDDSVCQGTREKVVPLSVQTPNTDAWVNEQRATGAEMCIKALVTSDDDSFEDAPNICANVAAQLRGAENVPVERLLLNKLQEGRA